eukprot:TRINITY_DN3597_c0_g1_i1.p1 TRINITY_DN3597_c0_g1~~TRINITY_DN3597_c0_g1_i1.p1  ORF type:complete len:481 (-),score=127.34 TRINITY_DN3597_c0_g1_i1:35-1477(-)
MASKMGIVLTQAPASGEGFKFVMAPHRSPNKQPVWDPKISHKDGFKVSLKNPERPSVLDELTRYHAINRVRTALKKICQKATDGQVEETPLLVFERWLFRGKFLAKVPGPDPVIPSPGVDREGLVADLVTIGGISKEVSEQICNQFFKAVKDALVEMKSVIKKNKTKAAKVEVLVKPHLHSLDVTAAIDEKELKLFFKIQPIYYEKLQSAFKSHGAAHGENNFHECLFVMLARYHAIHGQGFQMAVEGSSFGVLNKRLGVTMELCASPLNNWFPKFCSAFPDVDAPFGSVGSFFNFEPKSGSFQVNPPFILEMMNKMVSDVEKHLEKPKPFSFVVVVPGWQDTDYWKQLSASQFMRASWLISKKDHGFCDGNQHAKQDRLRESSYDTAVFVLQNDAGAQKWPVTEEVEAEFRKAMLNSVPTLPMISRRLQAGRGRADADGAAMATEETKGINPRKRKVKDFKPDKVKSYISKRFKADPHK